MKKKKIILILMVIILFLCLLGVVFYFLTQEEETETTQEMQPEARTRLATEYADLNSVMADGEEADWFEQRPDNFGLPYALKRAQGPIGYFMMDLDGDGVEELLIGEQKDYAFVIYGIYTGNIVGSLVPIYLSDNNEGLVLFEGHYLFYGDMAEMIVTMLSVPEEEITDTEKEEIEANLAKFCAYAYYLSEGELYSCEAPNPPALMELPEINFVSGEAE